MKKFLIFLFLIIAITIGEALGQESVSLAWDQDTDPTVVGYKLYYTTSSGLLVAGRTAPISGATSGSVGKVTSLTVSGLSGGVTYYFSLTAYNGSGIQSVLSNVVSAAYTYASAYAEAKSASQEGLKHVLLDRCDGVDNESVTAGRKGA
jgi:Fibronectin type III domain